MKKLFILFFILGCSSSIAPKPKHIEIKDNIENCSLACTHIKSLGCPEGNDLVYPGSSCNFDAECQDGICKNNKCTETCEMVCEAFVSNGRGLGLECWQTVKTCQEIETVCR